MPKKNTYLTITDQFCGAGGSSQGARVALAKVGIGAEGIRLAMNHWKLAIETHNTNFPETLHDCTDISASDPRRYPSTDILITSPECTNHSLSNGKKRLKSQMDMFDSGVLDASAERSRATMWDVPRFAEYHNYNAIIVENVVDAREWIMFEAWLMAMISLGYQHKCVYLNSMHAHPTPQSRDRMYVVFWKKGNKAPNLEYMPLAFSPKLGKNINAIQSWKNPLKKYGKYKQQYVYCCPETGHVVEPYYYAAFNCIDWSNIGTRIGDRKLKKFPTPYKGEYLLPLSPNSLTRIDFGIDKYGTEPFQLQTVNGGEHIHRTRSVSEPAFTHTTLQSQAFITLNEHTKTIPQVRNICEPVQTQATRQTMGICTTPFVTISRGKSLSRSSLDAITTQSTNITNGIVTTDAFNSFIQYNRQQSPTHISQPVQTVATVEQLSVVTYQKPKLEDCYYRMLKPKEIKLAMAFESGYIVLGSGKDQVRQLGNAVTPPAMEWLVERVIESLN